MKLMLIPLTKVEDNVLKDVVKHLEKCLSFNVTVWTERPGIPLTMFDFSRGQYRSDEVIAWVYRNFMIKGIDYIAALADVDAYVPGLNFVFGEASPHSRTCIVYLKRLRPEFYGEHDNVKFKERVVKEVLHEVGHILGLEHCSNERCVMRFSNSIFEVDFKSYRFCRLCGEKLSHRGLIVSSECVLR